MSREVVVFSPGTIANVGPGFDCLGICLNDFGDRISVAHSETDAIHVGGRDALEVPTEFGRNCLGIVADAVRRSLRHQGSLSITIERSLPLSGGLGASAASSMGAALATSVLLGHDPSLRQLLDWALVGEEAVAGRHLDNLVPCLLGGLTFSAFDQSGIESKPLARAFALGGELYFALVTPRVRVNTMQARQILPEQVQKSTYLKGISSVAGTLSALLSGDHELLAATLDDPFAVPARKNLVPHYEDAIQAAQQAGAIAASLSGSGPTIFAICADVDRASDTLESWGKIYSQIGASSHLCKASLPIASSLNELATFSTLYRSGAVQQKTPSTANLFGGVRIISISE